jgi:ribosomal protein L11 methyltransferase
MANDFIEIKFVCNREEQRNILVALLNGLDYEGFEEEENHLKAFIKSALFDETAIKQIAGRMNISFVISPVADTNWNQVWKSNFQPVTVENFCCIRADFHPPTKNVPYEIVITPKMSFGTGHHPTTYMMIERMRELSFTGKRVFDFGTGTGILAILAEKLGAESVLAIDNDESSIENATENIVKNNCTRIKIEKGDKPPSLKKFDIVLANIIRNVILENLEAIAAILNPGGILLLSGLLEYDEKEITIKGESLDLKTGKRLGKNNWICLKFHR